MEPQRYVAYVFDDLHAEVPDLVRTKDTASKYLTASMTPTDRAAIFTTSGRVVLDFTDNREQLLHTIAKIQPVRLMRAVPDQCPRMNYYFADQWINKNNEQLKEELISDTIRCLYLNVSDPIHIEAAKQLANEVLEKAAGLSFPLATRTCGCRCQFYETLLGSSPLMPGQRSLVLASPGFFSWDYSQMTPVFDRALHANIAINTLDVRGLWMDAISDAQNPRADQPSRPPIFEHYIHDVACTRVMYLPNSQTALAAPFSVTIMTCSKGSGAPRRLPSSLPCFPSRRRPESRRQISQPQSGGQQSARTHRSHAKGLLRTQPYAGCRRTDQVRHRRRSLLSRRTAGYPRRSAYRVLQVRHRSGERRRTDSRRFAASYLPQGSGSQSRHGHRCFRIIRPQRAVRLGAGKNRLSSTCVTTRCSAICKMVSP